MSAIALKGGKRTSRRVLARLTIRGELLCGACLLGVLLALFVIVPIVSPFDPTDFVAAPNQSPSARHPFGTDSLGRDLFVRCFAAGRNDVIIAAVAVSCSLTIGTIFGVLVGLIRNRVVEEFLLRLIDAVIAIPGVVLILTLIIIVGSDLRVLGLAPGVPTMILAVMLVGWAVYARLARTQTLVLRDREFVQAARMLGYSRARIVVRHIFPNVLGTALTFAAGDAMVVIMGVAGLAFLGSGIQEPTPELGTLIFQGRDLLSTAWWQSVMPAAIVVLLGFSLALLADAFASDA